MFYGIALPSHFDGVTSQSAMEMVFSVSFPCFPYSMFISLLVAFDLKLETDIVLADLISAFYVTYQYEQDSVVAFRGAWAEVPLYAS